MPDLTSGATAIAVMVAVALVTMTSRAIFSRRHGTSRAAGLQPLLARLSQTQRDLDHAVREHIRRGPAA